ncbi:MAG: mce [candidate division NC10 bacterium]|nr:mce [candidate division NC10 bacterium]
MFAGVNHVAVVVRNVGEALRFYHEVLGLPVGQQATVADQGVHAVLLPVGDDEIELLEPTNPAGGVARFLEKKGEGVHHLCMETRDVAAALARVKAANLPVIDQSPRKGLAGTIAFLHPGACHGVLVEMAQPPEAAHHAHQATPAASGIRATRINTIYVAAKDMANGGADRRKPAHAPGRGRDRCGGRGRPVPRRSARGRLGPLPRGRRFCRRGSLSEGEGDCPVGARRWERLARRSAACQQHARGQLVPGSARLTADRDARHVRGGA